MAIESKPEESLSATLTKEDGKGDTVNDTASTSSGAGSSSTGGQYPQLIQAMQQLLDNQKKGTKPLKSQPPVDPSKEHPFWSTQPVPKLGTVNGRLQSFLCW